MISSSTLSGHALQLVSFLPVPSLLTFIAGMGAHVDSVLVIAAATETPRGERSNAVGAHVAEGHKPYLKFIWRDVIFQLCRRCPFGQPREAPSPASPALGR